MTAVYVELADQYRRRIQSGELAPGTRLPTQSEMAAEHGVALATVHRFMRVLKLEGSIHTTHDGTYAGPRPADPRGGRRDGGA